MSGNLPILRANSHELAEAIAHPELKTRIHNVDKSVVGWSVPRGHVGLYGEDGQSRPDDGGTLDGELIPFRSSHLAEANVAPTDGGVTSKRRVLRDLTLVVDTNALGAGDVMGVTQEFPDVVRFPGGTAQLDSLIVVDAADQGTAFTVIMFEADVSIGALNAAPSVADADALKTVALIDVATGDYQDLAVSQVAHVSGLARTLQAAPTTKSFFVGLINGAGTPTYAGGTITLRFGFTVD